MDFMEKYYNLARDIYNISYDEEALIYEGINIDMVMNHNDIIKKGEIRHALYIIIKWIGWFQEKQVILFMMKRQVAKYQTGLKDTFIQNFNKNFEFLN